METHYPPNMQKSIEDHLDDPVNLLRFQVHEASIYALDEDERDQRLGIIEDNHLSHLAHFARAKVIKMIPDDIVA